MLKTYLPIIGELAVAALLALALTSLLLCLAAVE